MLYIVGQRPTNCNFVRIVSIFFASHHLPPDMPCGWSSSVLLHSDVTRRRNKDISSLGSWSHVPSRFSSRPLVMGSTLNGRHPTRPEQDAVPLAHAGPFMDRTAIDSISHARGRQLFARQIRICWIDRVPLPWRGPSTCPKPRWIRDSPSVHPTSRSIDDRRRPDRWGSSPGASLGSICTVRSEPVLICMAVLSMSSPPSCYRPVG